MTLISPQLLQRLGRSRLLARAEGAATGAGERRSRGKGPGLEFEDHRPYEPGDDIRHLDRHVYARLGQHYLKQYAAYGQLSVTLILDGSASMAYGSPEKLAYAKAMVAGLAHVTLVGGDQVALCAITNKVEWHARVQGTGRLGVLLPWLERISAGGGGDLVQGVRGIVPRLARGGVCVVVSDWLFEGAEALVAALDKARQQVVLIQLLAPEELEPALVGSGAVRLIDAETGAEVEVALEPEAFTRYQRELAMWRDGLAEAARRRRGWFFQVRTDEALDDLFLRRWRREGLIG